MVLNWAKLISSIVHPLFMPLALTWMAVTYDSTLHALVHPTRLNLAYLILLVGTILFPLINFLLLLRLGTITNLDIRRQNERTIPFLMALVYYGLTYYLLRKGQLPSIFYAIHFSALLVLILAMVINLRFKISVHSIAVAGALGCLAGLFLRHGTGNTAVLSLMILLTGLVMSSRLKLGVHTPAQVYSGAILGFLVCFNVVYFGWMI